MYRLSHKLTIYIANQVYVKLYVCGYVGEATWIHLNYFLQVCKKASRKWYNKGLIGKYILYNCIWELNEL